MAEARRRLGRYGPRRQAPFKASEPAHKNTAIGAPPLYGAWLVGTSGWSEGYSSSSPLSIASAIAQCMAMPRLITVSSSTMRLECSGQQLR